MISPPRLRPAVFDAKERLAAGREKLRQQHESGSPALQVCARWTDLIDSLLLDLLESALSDLDPRESGGLASQIALVPHGGFGRRDLAPYSDIDLMLLHRPSADQRVKPLAARLSRDIVDMGLKLGFSTRTPAQCVSLAFGDPKIFTSLVESRFLSGSVSLFSKFMRRFRRSSMRHSQSLIAMVRQSRREERSQFGDSLYLLHPNVKRSRGCLREIQLLRWVGFARYGQCEPRQLYDAGVLSRYDRTRLHEARNFFLGLRNELHFHANKAQDTLERSEQIRIAKLSGFEGSEGILPVEQFMREVFEHSSQVRYMVTQFVFSAKIHSPLVRLFAPLLSHRVADDFRVSPLHVSAAAEGLAIVRGDLERVLCLMELANFYDKPIAHETWESIRQTMLNDVDDIKLSPKATERFLSLMGQSANLGDRLRRLHHLRVLEKIIPPMKHARCLMQFNDYHKYTVDEHSIRTVERATEFVDDKGPLGEAYRGMRNKTILHLALLLHDLGKGFPEDHSELGERLADETGVHLGLSERDRETLKYLVRYHLVMNHTALRRNIDDDEVVLQFAVEVGSPERLQMMYILSCADLAAVGPGVLNPWKLNLLTELYRRTRRHLAWEDSSAGYQSWVKRRRAEIRALIKCDESEMLSWENQLRDLPVSYIVNNPPDRVVEELELLRRLPSNDVVVWARFRSKRKAVEYTVAAHHNIVSGIFHRLTGTLSSTGHEILSAEINTLPGNYVLDRFYVNDLDTSGIPSQERIDEVCDALSASLKEPTDEPPSFRRVWNNDEKSGEIIQVPTKVRVDNSTSERYTIIDVFAHDRMGLLYTITRALYELGLSVAVAKIGTYLDQVVDVFYVTDEHGSKIEQESRIQAIREKLIDKIEEPKSEVSEV